MEIAAEISLTLEWCGLAVPLDPNQRGEFERKVREFQERGCDPVLASDFALTSMTLRRVAWGIWKLLGVPRTSWCLPLATGEPAPAAEEEKDALFEHGGEACTFCEYLKTARVALEDKLVHLEPETMQAQQLARYGDYVHAAQLGLRFVKWLEDGTRREPPVRFTICHAGLGDEQGTITIDADEGRVIFRLSTTPDLRFYQFRIYPPDIAALVREIPEVQWACETDEAGHEFFPGRRSVDRYGDGETSLGGLQPAASPSQAARWHNDVRRKLDEYIGDPLTLVFDPSPLPGEVGIAYLAKVAFNGLLTELRHRRVVARRERIDTAVLETTADPRPGEAIETAARDVADAAQREELVRVDHGLLAEIYAMDNGEEGPPPAREADSPAEEGEGEEEAVPAAQHGDPAELLKDAYARFWTELYMQASKARRNPRWAQAVLAFEQVADANSYVDDPTEISKLVRKHMPGDRDANDFRQVRLNVRNHIKKDESLRLVLELLPDGQ